MTTAHTATPNGMIEPVTAAQIQARNAGYTVHSPCPIDPLDKSASYAWCLDGDYSEEFTTPELAWNDAIAALAKAGAA